MSDSFEILAADYRPMVRTYLRTLLNDVELAEDLTQETMLAAYQNLDQFTAGGNFGAWLRGIARNKMKESFRAAARRPLVVDSRIIAGMEEVYTSLDASATRSGPWMDRLDAVRSCIKKLSPNLSSAVQLVYVKGQSIKQAAESADVSFDALGKRLSRARELIRRCVASQPGENS